MGYWKFQEGGVLKREIELKWDRVQAKIPCVEGIEIFSETRKLCLLIFYYCLLVNLPSKFTSVFHVCPVIEHEFHHNIVKVAVDMRDNTRLDS